MRLPRLSSPLVCILHVLTARRQRHSREIGTGAAHRASWALASPKRSRACACVALCSFITWATLPNSENPAAPSRALTCLPSWPARCCPSSAGLSA